MFAVGLFDKPNNNTMKNNVTNQQQVNIARNISAWSTILLKNQDKILPLTVGKYAKIGVFGAAADKSPIFAGDGSGHV